MKSKSGLAKYFYHLFLLMSLLPPLTIGAPTKSIALGTTVRSVSFFDHERGVDRISGKEGGNTLMGVGQTEGIPELKLQLGHGFNIAAVSLSPNEEFAVTAGNEGGVNLWSLTSGAFLHRFDTKGRTALFSPNGRFILTGGAQTTLWDATTLKPIRYFVKEEPYSESLAFSPNGELILVADRKKVHLCEVATGNEIKAFDFSPAGILSTTVELVAFSPDGRHFVIAGDQVTLWNLETLAPVRSFGTTPATGITYSPSGKFVLVVNSNQSVPSGFEVVVYDAESGQRLRSLKMAAGRQSIDYVTFSKDGTRVLLGALTRAEVQDFETGTKISSIENLFSAHGESTFFKDGTRILSGNTIWRTETGEEITKLESYSPQIWTAKLSPNGEFLLTQTRDEFILWQLNLGKEIKRFKRSRLAMIQPQDDPTQVLSITFSPDSNLILINSRGTVSFRSPLTDDPLPLQIKQSQPVEIAIISPDNRYIVLGNRLHDLSSGEILFEYPQNVQVRTATFSPDFNYVVFTIRPATFQDPAVNGCRWDHMVLWNLKNRVEEGRSECTINIDVAKFTPDSKYVLAARNDDVDKNVYLRLWNFKNWTKQSDYIGHEGAVFDTEFSSGNGNFVVSGSVDGTTRLWDTLTGKELGQFKGHEFYVKSVNFTPDGQHLITASADDTIRVWRNDADRKELCRLISLRDGTWVVVTPDGRFDTNNLERIRGLHWIMPSDPLTALPVEIFMRPYYEPQLLRRLLANDDFREIPSLAELNRVQPKISITEVKKEDAGAATVTVEVQNVRHIYKHANNQVVESGGKDLRLFRDGQLVSYRDGDLFAKGQTATSGCEPIAGSALKCRAVFEHIRLPRQKDVQEVEFSAYAFNSADVKSETVRLPFKFTPELPSRKGRVYLITVGVSKYENAAWDLEFAANDSHLIDDTVAPKLRATGDYDEVVNVALTAEDKITNGQKLLIKNATKDNFRRVMQLLAGDKLPESETSEIPNATKIEKATPDDVVMIFYSSHGYRDTERFYLFPYDTGPGEGRDPEAVVPQSISSDDLYQWLRNIDAGDLVFVIDACHAAAVTGKEFKPGPMGSRGMGQLAYDKGMRILAATQPDTTAAEVDNLNQKRKIQHGLLTYALVADGLIDSQADSNGDKLITMTEWLQFGVMDVPKLFAEAAKPQNADASQAPLTKRGTNQVRFISRGDGDNSTQQPSLFDFTDKLRRKRQLPVDKVSPATR